MASVMGLAVLVFYFAALLGVNLVDRGLGIMPRPGNAEVPESITENWQTIPNSMFNLFKVMNADASGVEEPFMWQYEQLLVHRVIELTLKAIYMLQRHIGSPLSQVWGNWLDNVNVIVGIGESWIALLLTDRTRPSTPSLWPT